MYKKHDIQNCDEGTCDGGGGEKRVINEKVGIKKTMLFINEKVVIDTNMINRRWALTKKHDKHASNGTWTLINLLVTKKSIIDDVVLTSCNFLHQM